ncbi:type IV-A pilus assembly ATPase PilB [Candidatus Uhrbacteria bacterium]|nr:type IV-A pilus assembly ATPase PilB [Candidatus Uhrbacteria bacterium]
MISASDTRLGELLVHNKDISPLQLQEALDRVKQTGGPLSYELVRYGVIDENAIVHALRRQFDVQPVDLSEASPDSKVLKLIPRMLVDRYRMVPLSLSGNTLTVVMVDPGDLVARRDIEVKTGHKLEVVVAPESQINALIDRCYLSAKTFKNALEELGLSDDGLEVEKDAEEDVTAAELEEVAGEAPVIRLVNFILASAIKNRASDIHIEPFERQVRVRFRIDGVLYDVLKPPFKYRNAIISRVKILARLDISERRKPQDGRIKLKLGGRRNIDLRVGVIPTQHGEYVVIRILDQSKLQLDMTKLGLESSELEGFRAALHAPSGMVLVTGPTGSGKTTTLYSALSDINVVGTNILTVEQPVEYDIFGIKQTEVNVEAGLTFAAALRSFLRLDPDVILVGEIRDFETAETAVQAAMTGHLVLSTLHTNDAPSTIARLTEMGVPAFEIAACVRMIIAQRLVRRLCETCREPQDVPRQTLLDLGVPSDESDEYTCLRAVGCPACNETGYMGRIAIYEIMALTSDLCEQIAAGATTEQLRREAVRGGMKTLRVSALAKLRDGVTSLEEVMRVTGHD